AGAELRRACALQPGKVPRRLDHRHLHPEADAEIRHFSFAREAGRLNLPQRAALAEPARYQDAMNVLEPLDRAFTLEGLRLDPFRVHLHPVRDAAMGEGLDQRLV